jgi:heme/copper-type cytochrome/quinol oxidase subunit 2
MKTKKIIIRLLIASCLLFLMAGNVSAAPGDLPELGPMSAPANTTDVTSGLGIFSTIGKYILEYALQICIFMAVVVIVILNARGSLARSNQRSEEAAEIRRNVKESIQDNGWTIIALMVVFFIFIPIVKSFVVS